MRQKPSFSRFKNPNDDKHIHLSRCFEIGYQWQKGIGMNHKPVEIKPHDFKIIWSKKNMIKTIHENNENQTTSYQNNYSPVKDILRGNFYHYRPISINKKNPKYITKHYILKNWKKNSEHKFS